MEKVVEILKQLWLALTEFFGSKKDETVEAPEKEEPPVIDNSAYYLKLVKHGTTTKEGLALLRLELWQGLKRINFVEATSGAPGRQYFRLPAESMQGSLEPLPQGKYKVGPTEWKVKGDFTKSWGEGLGPLWWELTPLFNKTRRSALGIHYDENKSYSPGTAGCIGVRNLEGLKEVLKWFDNPATAPKEIDVDYALSTSKPSSIPDRFISSPNITKTREQKVTMIVLHNTEGSLSSAIAHFQTTASQVSAHYIVGRSGEIVQMVQEANVAWHAGNRTVNHMSIGIEIEAGGSVGKGMTTAQEASVIRLIKAIQSKHGITLNNIIPHRHATATSCPGSIWATDTLLESWKKQNL